MIGKLLFNYAVIVHGELFVAEYIIDLKNRYHCVVRHTPSKPLLAKCIVHAFADGIDTVGHRCVVEVAHHYTWVRTAFNMFA